MVCQCPSDHPFETPQGCIQCYLPNYFDVTSQACLSCPKNNFFNTASSRCEPCPIDRPITVNSVCSAFPDNNYYNQTAAACQLCSGNRNYSKQTGQCVCPSITPYFDG